MNSKKTNRFVLSAIQIAVICLVGSIAAICAQAQCPSSASINPIRAAMGETIENMRAAGIIVECIPGNNYDGMMTFAYPDGTYAVLRVSNGASNMTVTDPSGRTTDFYLLFGDQLNLIIHDSVYGFINTGDGWYSIFDPLGNPFSAAIQDPLNAMTVWTWVIHSPGAAGDFRVPPAPIQVEGGIY